VTRQKSDPSTHTKHHETQVVVRVILRELVDRFFVLINNLIT